MVGRNFQAVVPPGPWLGDPDLDRSHPLQVQPPLTSSGTFPRGCCSSGTFFASGWAPGGFQAIGSSFGTFQGFGCPCACPFAGASCKGGIFGQQGQFSGGKLGFAGKSGL